MRAEIAYQRRRAKTSPRSAAKTPACAVNALPVCARHEVHREQASEEHQFLRQEHNRADTDHIGSVQCRNTLWCCHTCVSNCARHVYQYDGFSGGSHLVPPPLCRFMALPAEGFQLLHISKKFREPVELFCCFIRRTVFAGHPPRYHYPVLPPYGAAQYYPRRKNNAAFFTPTRKETHITLYWPCFASATTFG